MSHLTFTIRPVQPPQIFEINTTKDSWLFFVSSHFLVYVCIGKWLSHCLCVATAYMCRWFVHIARYFHFRWRWLIFYVASVFVNVAVYMGNVCFTQFWHNCIRRSYVRLFVISFYVHNNKTKNIKSVWSLYTRYSIAHRMRMFQCIYLLLYLMEKCWSGLSLLWLNFSFVWV